MSLEIGYGPLQESGEAASTTLKPCLQNSIHLCTLKILYNFVSKKFKQGTLASLRGSQFSITC